MPTPLNRPNSIALLKKILKTNLWYGYEISVRKFEYRYEDNEEFLDITAKNGKMATYEIRKGSIPGYLDRIAQELKNE